MAPQVKSWVKGALYVATDDTEAASPLTEPVDFNYDPGANDEATPYAGASVTPNVVLLPTPSLAVNYNRRADEDVILKAARHCRDNLTGVRWYLYVDTTNEPNAYAYGFGLVKPTVAGGATSAIKGSATIIPDYQGTWNDDLLVG